VASRVAQYSVEGAFMSEVKLPTDHITCPAFGGADMRSLFITSAREGLTSQQLSRQPEAGSVFVVQSEFVGQKEHQVIL
jgi:sugar lactone lactonase YvrE